MVTAKLQKARDLADTPFNISSGCRCFKHNREVGGANGSSHLAGWAVDISVASSRERFLIVSALLQAGFTRIGVSENFIHVDLDPIKPPCVIWLY
jgi:uncharacterized protein YcbK (DUF882 family)